MRENMPHLFLLYVEHRAYHEAKKGAGAGSHFIQISGLHYMLVKFFSTYQLPRQAPIYKKRSRRNVMHEDDADAQDDVTYEEREIINRAGNVKTSESCCGATGG